MIAVFDGSEATLGGDALPCLAVDVGEYAGLTAVIPAVIAAVKEEVGRVEADRLKGSEPTVTRRKLMLLAEDRDVQGFGLFRHAASINSLLREGFRL